MARWTRSQAREVVHDMRQPLSVISALVAAAEARHDVPGEVRTCLEQIKGQVRNLSELCHGILKDSEPVRLLAVDQLVSEVVSDAQLAHGRVIELTTTPAEVRGEELSLRRAVWNLLENACRAAGPHWVRVAVDRSGGNVHIDVSDGGPGFRNGPPGTSSLGLTIVDSVVRRHGGRVHVRRAHPSGVMVTIVLPASETSARSGALATTALGLEGPVAEAR